MDLVKHLAYLSCTLRRGVVWESINPPSATPGRAGPFPTGSRIDVRRDPPRDAYLTMRVALPSPHERSRWTAAGPARG